MAGAAAQDAAEQLLHLKLAFLAGEPPACVLALARIISEVELSSGTVIDGLYEEFAQHDNVSSRLISVVARLSCSSNMLEGDTGCSLWPSSLFLSEFILSYPEIFSTKCCFELGSGVGLVGICLNYVGASKVILTDGDTSTLTNMKENMEMNSLCIEQEDSEMLKKSKNKVECKIFLGNMCLKVIYGATSQT
ncbi:hypothetical protein C2845_PM06G07430 [Panicum miliaceum]|uniref:Uncharacterized protein n=1 Tax=Panicum miliaceum TaxID=4540 RepID=A0A3L6R6L9_PANMI|nr:hypothetical protein C2845_PM06G07430 [Panicum miliaceum]